MPSEMLLSDATAHKKGRSTAPLLVELPGNETEHLPGKMLSDLGFRSISFQFGTARYLRFRFRVLTASRALASRRELPESRGWIRA